MITLFASGTLTPTGSSTEDSLASCNVQGGFTLQLDLSGMAVGDRIRVIVYSIALTGGTKRFLDFRDYEAAAPTFAVAVRPFPELVNDLAEANAIQFTVTQTHGTADISLPWKVMKNDALTPTTTARTLGVSAGGVADANLAQILGTALTETAGQLAAGFKKFFNVASPRIDLNDLSYILAAVAGESDGNGTGTVNFYDKSDVLMFTVTINGSNERTEVTYF